ncbi:MAG: class I SAM-dependent methyltransferase [Pseudomonadota bacterium]
MRPDVLALKAFYASPLGDKAAAAIASALPEAKPGERVLVLGYGVPYVHTIARDAERIVAAMPARQGAIALSYSNIQAPKCKTANPAKGAATNVSCLTDVEDLPFPDAMFDYVLLVHCLEFSGRVGTTLMEIARVLAPGGQVYAVVPNRLGAWSRADATPFGNGRPFSARQLSALMREAGLTPCAWNVALMLPPFKALGRWLNTAERPGRLIWPRFGGVFVVTAKKEVFAAKLKPKTGLAAQVPLRVPAFAPAAVAMEPKGAAARSG